MSFEEVECFIALGELTMLLNICFSFVGFWVNLAFSARDASDIFFDHFGESWAWVLLKLSFCCCSRISRTY